MTVMYAAVVAVMGLVAWGTIIDREKLRRALRTLKIGLRVHG